MSAPGTNFNNSFFPHKEQHKFTFNNTIVFQFINQLIMAIRAITSTYVLEE